MTARVPTLTDGTVTLRAPRDSDIEGSYEQCQDPVSQAWTTRPGPLHPRRTRETYVRHIIPGGWETDREWSFVVEAADDAGEPRFAGIISLRNEGQGRAEIAYGSHPWVRGRGVMEPALRLLLDWGFAHRDLQDRDLAGPARQLALAAAGLAAGVRRRPARCAAGWSSAAS